MTEDEKIKVIELCFVSVLQNLDIRHPMRSRLPSNHMKRVEDLKVDLGLDDMQFTVNTLVALGFYDRDDVFYSKVIEDEVNN